MTAGTLERGVRLGGGPSRYDVVVLDVRKPPRRYADEFIRLFRVARWLGSRVWPGRAAYARSLRRGLRGETVDVPVPGLHPDADGLRLVQLSDLHAGCFLDEASLDPVIALASSFEPDVLCVTGDFVTRGAFEVELLGRAFARIPAPLGKFAVFGNHDYRRRQEGAITASLRRQGVVVLRDASALVMRGAARVRIAGLEDIEESRKADLDAATAAFDGSEHARILLCHHPDIGDLLPAGRFDLVLSGHSHGGQIVLPLVGSLGRAWMPSRIGGRYPLPGGGLHYVNRGIGVMVLPFRVGAPPEVTCLVLRRAPTASAPAPNSLG